MDRKIVVVGWTEMIIIWTLIKLYGKKASFSIAWICSFIHSLIDYKIKYWFKIRTKKTYLLDMYVQRQVNPKKIINKKTAFSEGDRQSHIRSHFFWLTQSLKHRCDQWWAIRRHCFLTTSGISFIEK